jgi:hypothetical protein
MTSRDKIGEWFDRGVEKGAAYMGVWWDRFDGPEGDYPAYYDTRAEAQAAINTPKDDKLMEVYDLRGSKVHQLALDYRWALRPERG